MLNNDKVNKRYMFKLSIYWCGNMTEFDAIVIGAGHNGLITAGYLAKAGMSVAVIEKRYEAGGGLCTEQITLPGFLHNLHSYYHILADHMPAYKDLELEKHGARYICPETQAGLVSGDKALKIYENIDKTQKSIAKFSEKDAKTYRKVQEDYAEYMETIIIPAIYSPPVTPSERYAALEGTPEGRTFLELDRSSPLEVVDDLFECEELKAEILHDLIYPRWVLPEYHGLGSMAILSISQVERRQLVIGGSHTLAHALWRSLKASGGVVLANRAVRKILIKNGAATGVEVADGTKYIAKKVVASSIDLKQTFLELIGEEYLDENLIQQIKNYKSDDFSIFTIHLALNEPPKYIPDVNDAFHIILNSETPEKIIDQFLQIRKGKVKDPILYCSTPTLWDKTQALLSKHTAVAAIPVPYKLKKGSWDDYKEEFIEMCIEKWSEFAPNLEKNILGKAGVSPLDIERRLSNMVNGSAFMGRITQDQMEFFRPTPELSRYKTPIKKFYLCGSCCHPGGGITGGPGYIAAMTILEDLGVEL